MSIKNRLKALEAKTSEIATKVKRHFTNGVLTDVQADLLVTCVGLDKKPLNGWHYVPYYKPLSIDIV